MNLCIICPVDRNAISVLLVPMNDWSTGNPVNGDQTFLHFKTQPFQNTIKFNPKLKTVQKQVSPFAVQDILDGCLGDDGVVAFEPLVLVLPDEGGVVAALQRPLVVHHRKQTVPTSNREEEPFSLDGEWVWDESGYTTTRQQSTQKETNSRLFATVYLNANQGSSSPMQQQNFQHDQSKQI